MPHNPGGFGDLPDDMAEYLQVFLDETREQLDDLVESLLVLERDPTSAKDLNEAFRLIHSIKGSAGMMGFDNITVLTHHLENRFEQFRSGTDTLERATMNLVLRCIDFLRECIAKLCAGEQMGGSSQLLAELKALESQPPTAASPVAETGPKPAPQHTEEPAVRQSAQPAAPAGTGEDHIQIAVLFEADLLLADLKAQLIVSRLANLGDIVATQPGLHELENAGDLTRFEIVLNSDCSQEDIRAAADVDGVAEVTLSGGGTEQAAAERQDAHPVPATPDVTQDDPAPDDIDTPPPHAPQPDMATPAVADATAQTDTSVGISVLDSMAETPRARPPEAADEALEPAARPKARIAETMRVDIERLDNLMNLAGELVVNKARFVQVADQGGPAFKGANVINRARDFGESLQRTIDQLKGLSGRNGEWSSRIQELESGLELLEEQAAAWDTGRRCFGQISEAIDQLTRVSNSLQRGVLETRMVPVGPLFTRFNRVVRDLAIERGKEVHLEIVGEKTELDKRMIDELGDPLVHLVRNSIDHGLEPTEVRRQRGKSETGTITLEAGHSGNNVLIRIHDDGGGIDVARIRTKIAERSLLSTEEVASLTDEQALDYIWHAGFSTAAEITDISGRGVGMDVVRTRITELNGAIEIQTLPGHGTTFTIRLPLTLAIINSLLVRIRDVIFSMPIDDVREIVAVRPADIVTVRGHKTFEVRGEYVPLVCIDDVFEWHDVDYGYRGDSAHPADERMHSVVILSSGGKTLGLRTDELLGSQDIVIKSFAENFVPIAGLSGASILGDGTVCLMLDVNRFIGMATGSPHDSVATGVTQHGSAG